MTDHHSDSQSEAERLVELRSHYARERQALERDMAERATKAKRDETLQWAASRRAVSREETVTKSHASAHAPRRSAPPGPAAFTINEVIAAVGIKFREADQRMVKIAMTAVAQVLVEQEKKQRAELEAEVAKLRNEFLQDRLDAERGVRRLKPVPDKGSMTA
jgi:hypothetical protein